jgi:hypothetical protein
MGYGTRMGRCQDCVSVALFRPSLATSFRVTVKIPPFAEFHQGGLGSLRTLCCDKAAHGSEWMHNEQSKACLNLGVAAYHSVVVRLSSSDSWIRIRLPASQPPPACAVSWVAVRHPVYCVNDFLALHLVCWVL